MHLCLRCGPRITLKILEICSGCGSGSAAAAKEARENFDVDVQIFSVDGKPKFLRGEGIIEPIHHPSRELAVQSQLTEFPCEQSLLVRRVWDLPRLGEKVRGVQYLDLIVRINDPGAKGDRRNVTFARGSQTKNESQSTRGQIGLVGVRNDGWIKQRSGFERIFGKEVGAD